MGVMVKEKLCAKVEKVRRVSDRVMNAIVALEEDGLRLICGHVPQSGRSLDEKRTFYGEIKCDWDMHFAGDLVMCLGDINEYIGRHIDGLHGDHGGYGIDEKK